MLPGPVLDAAQLASALRPLRERGQRIVLTNGVFDLLHVGHLRYLKNARKRGDVLVVGVNADASVRKRGRPLVPDVERAELVAALEPVDFVVIFPEVTADHLIRDVRPQVYAKGADYTPETLPEAATVAEVGAELAFIPLVAGRSTSELIARYSAS